ncbi:MAG TPA: hypothetical protein VK196_15500 [Magnetospirillum sp.]|nr:hypothetical protein [Magnetospirillum sp.]
MWRYVVGAAAVLAATPVLADPDSLTWRLAEGADYKTGITCDGCGLGEYVYAWMSCETGRQDELGRTTLYILGDVCGTDPKCNPYLIVDGVRMSVRTRDIDDDEGVAIVINEHPRLWKALMDVHSLTFGMKGKQVLDLTLPGLTSTFSQVLTTCRGR